MFLVASIRPIYPIKHWPYEMTFAVQFPLHWPADYFTPYLIIKNNKQWSHQNDVKYVPEWGLMHLL